MERNGNGFENGFFSSSPHSRVPKSKSFQKMASLHDKSDSLTHDKDLCAIHRHLLPSGASNFRMEMDTVWRSRAMRASSLRTAAAAAAASAMPFTVGQNPTFTSCADNTVINHTNSDLDVNPPSHLEVSCTVSKSSFIHETPAPLRIRRRFWDRLLACFGTLDDVTFKPNFRA